MIRELLSRPPLNGEYHTVGVDGRGASGKSTLGRVLSTLLDGFVLTRGDDYFEPMEHPVLPGYFNADRYMSDIGDSLNQGQRDPVYRPYTWPGRERMPHRQLDITGGLVHEGVYGLRLPINWDVTIWVDTPREVCLERFNARAEANRQSTRTPEQIHAAGLEWARGMDEYIAQTQPHRNANIVVDGLRPFEPQLGL